MSAITGIEWTDRTWNPVTGCTKVSPGCAHCYAEGVANRFFATKYPQVMGIGTNGDDGRLYRPRVFTDVQTHEDRLLKPLSWRKPARVFVNSMSDLFHEDVPDAFIAAVFGVMAACGQHTFQILTKRPERMLRWFDWIAKELPSRHEYGAARGVRWYAWNRGVEDAGLSYSIHNPPTWPWPLPNVWLGVSVENQKFADERIPLLLQTPAAVRFISAEPLLAHVNLVQFMASNYISQGGRQWVGAGGIGWVIVGGESGAGARPFDLAWARSIVAQCKAAGVACFVKQLGARPHDRDRDWLDQQCGVITNRVPLLNRKGGSPEEWPADLRVREFPEARA